MKIMLIIPTLGYGGAESLVLSWLRYWLEAPEISRIILVLYSDINLDRLGDMRRNKKFRLEIEKTNTPWRMLRPRYFLHLFRLRRMILKHDPDIVHTNLVADIDLALLFRLLPKHLRFVHTVHCPADHDGKGKYRRLLAAFYRSKRVTPVAISSTVRDTITQYYGVESHLIFNGADIPPQTGDFEKVQAEVEALATGGGGGRKYVCLAVGRVMYPKNYELMTAVFRRLHREGEPVVLIVLGDLVSEENRKRYLPLKSENIFFMGVKSNVGDYLRCCNFFCMTSLFEGLSIAFTEAMGAGKIPVMTPTESLLESLGDRQNGFVAQDFSEDAYYDAVKRAETTPKDDLENISRRLVLRYERIFAISTCARNYIELFKKISSVANRKREYEKNTDNP